MTQQCPNCGHEFKRPELPTVLKDLLFRRSRYVNIEEYLSVKCSSCGHVQDVQRRFVGVLSSRDVRILVTVLLTITLAGIGYVFYSNLARM
jgi:uncharacterized Zn finger protein